MFDVYRETCFSQKNFYNCAKLFKEDQNSIQDEDRPTMAHLKGWIQLMNSFWLTEELQ